MIRIAYVANPFDPIASRVIRDIPVGRSIREMIAEFPVNPGYHIEISLDGSRMTSPDRLEFVPKSGSSVVFCAVPQDEGKNPLAIVAMLALTIAAPYLGAAGSQALYGAYAISGASVGLAASVISMGALVAGGLLISSVFRPSGPDAGPASSSPTYSWGVANNAVAEGVVLPELLGTHRVVPPIIGHYVEVAGDKQFLNLLFAVAGHQVDSVSGIRVNETAIEDMTDVTTDTRLGLVTQPVLQHFSDTRVDTAVGAKLSVGTWTSRTTSGNAVQRISVTLSFPKGLFYVHNDGSMRPVNVKVYVEYSVHDADSWTRLKEYNSAPEVITTGRWSGGEYVREADSTPGTMEWWEYEEGSATPGDHVEGASYVSSLWVVDPEFGGAGHYKTLIWHWVEGLTITKIGTVLHDYITISESRTSPMHRSYATGELAPGQYDIRCSLVEDPTAGGAPIFGLSNISPNRSASDVYFESFQQSVFDDFTYPGVALVALRALATDQLSGSIPRIDMLATRSTVPVWTGAAYAQKSASNPAWGCYHLLHQARYKGTGSVTAASSYDVLGVPTDRIDYREFMRWAGWCENPAGDFSLTPHTCNVYFDTAMSLRKALDIVGACGRGVVVQIGTKFTPIVDRPEQTPVQRFLLTPGNIVAGSFQEQFLPMQDRANSVEVTYFDAAQDYTRQAVEEYASDFDTTDREINKASVTLYGVTNRQKAIDYARFLLNSNRYLTNTISLEADVDSIACIPGDVIEVAHDVPQWGYGGRIVSATTNTVTIDREVTLEAATSYSIMVKHQDDDAREEKAITTGAGTYSTLSISGTWAKTPEAHALYSVGEVDSVVKEFRVLRIGTGQDLRRKISALEYTQEVYEDGAEIPEPENISDLPLIDGLSAVEVYRGGQETKVYLKWRGLGLFWNVFYRMGGGILPITSNPWIRHGKAYSPSYELGGLSYGVLYQFSVSATDSPFDGEVVSITLRGKIDPPGNVPSIVATEREFSVLVEWDAVTDFDLAGYELRVELIDEPYPYPNFVPNWTGAEMLFKGNVRSHIWTYKVIGAYCLHVRAFDAFGLYSVASTTVIVDIGAPDQPEGSYAFSGPNAVLSWNIPFSAFAIDRYVVSYGDDYATATEVGTTKGTTLSVNADWGGIRRYWVAAIDVAGNVGTPESIDVNVISPGAVGALTPRVIDNNVLLQWTAPTTGSLPIAHYEVAKGDLYEVSVSVGTVQGTFSVVFEEAAGSFTYWVVAYDSAGNAGTPTGIPATVSQPPDYVLLQSWEDDFSGTKTAALLENGKLYAPINITETYEESFTAYSHATWQAQITAGYPMWAQPTPETGSYQRVFDYGTLIPGLTKISLAVTWGNVYGEATISPTIEVSADNVSWGTPVTAYSALESGFRYVRVTLDIDGGDGNQTFLRIDSVRLKLDLKQVADSGRVQITSSGQQVDFNAAFLDITSITVSVEGTTALFAIYDFTDAPNPGHFHIYIFDAGGVDRSTVGHYVSWTARGV